MGFHTSFWCLAICYALELSRLVVCYKPGYCPLIQEATSLCWRRISCVTDSECGEKKKCCKTACGRAFCTNPSADDPRRHGYSLDIQPSYVSVKTGETVYVNCTTANIDVPFHIHWNALGSARDTGSFQEIMPNKHTVILLIQDAQLEHSGLYRCQLSPRGTTESTTRLLQILVHNDGIGVFPTLPTGKQKLISEKAKGDNCPLPCNSGVIFSVCAKDVYESCRVLHKNINKTESGDKIFDFLYSGKIALTVKFCRNTLSCRPNIKIPCHHQCDGHMDCPYGEDEMDCPDVACAGKFRCNNTQCIDYAYVCDSLNQCDDWSDEDRCQFTVTTEPFSKDNSQEDDQMIWLKTTVYTVIACTVGIVLLISVIVITIFRIKMKRAAIRRALRQAERRRHHGNRSDSHNNSRSQRNEPVEQEPFISAPSPTHFGNIIVNVNNGVQYIPSSEFRAGIQSPPTYSEVLAESGRIGRHSPPPEYSTIDRNPNRSSLSQDSQLHMQLLNETRSSENGEAPSETAGDIERSELQHSCSVDDDQVSNSAANEISTLCSDHDVEHTNSLGRSQTRSPRGRHARNVRSVVSPRRPKQLKVRDGQIVLDDDSSNSSSPETVNRNTQTNPSDISQAKPAQIQVHGGQIILANQEAACSLSAGNNAESDGATAQGQLDVKDGHIVFKPSES